MLAVFEKFEYESRCHESWSGRKPIGYFSPDPALIWNIKEVERSTLNFLGV
jgi:hypothetical protein